METNAHRRALETRGHARFRLDRALLILPSFWLFACGLAGAIAPARLWAAGAGREPDPLAAVLDHMYNLEFQPARQLLELLLRQQPTDLRARNYLAESILDQEMLNEGLLSTGAYLDRGEAFRKRSAPLRVSFEGELLRTLDKVQALAEVRLKQNPEDQEALYWAGVEHGTRAEFYFALARSYHAAMHEGLQAPKYEMRLARVNPRSADALLILGIADYAVGSLPWYLKVFVSLAGLRGNRARGIAEMERASQEACWAREDAKFVLVAVYRREKMYDKALADLHLLAQSYPRNFVVRLETARIHKDRDEWISAARVYDALVSKLQSNEAGGSTTPAPRILYLAGQAHEHMGEQEKALRLYEQAGALAGDSIDIYRAELAAASLYQRLGRLAEAERNYRRVVSAVPDTEEAERPAGLCRISLIVKSHNAVNAIQHT